MKKELKPVNKEYRSFLSKDQESLVSMYCGVKSTAQKTNPFKIFATLETNIYIKTCNPNDCKLYNLFPVIPFDRKGDVRSSKDIEILTKRLRNVEATIKGVAEIMTAIRENRDHTASIDLGDDTMSIIFFSIKIPKYCIITNANNQQVKLLIDEFKTFESMLKKYHVALKAGIEYFKVCVKGNR